MFMCLCSLLLLFYCKGKSDRIEKIEFHRNEKSIKYELRREGWHDDFMFATRDYDSGIQYLEDRQRNTLFIFDSCADIYKLNSENGILIDTINIVGRYGYYRNSQKNKLLYAYPALFYYYDEVLVHLDMDFNVKAYYLDSMSQVIDARFPNGYLYELYIDSVRLMPPDKVWVRMNDEHGNIEVMIFGVNATMEAPVIYSTYIFR